MPKGLTNIPIIDFICVTGRKTTTLVRALAITAMTTSLVPAIEAVFISSPLVILRTIFSRTTIELVTKTPVALPNAIRVIISKP